MSNDRDWEKQLWTIGGQLEMIVPALEKSADKIEKLNTKSELAAQEMKLLKEQLDKDGKALATRIDEGDRTFKELRESAIGFKKDIDELRGYVRGSKSRAWDVAKIVFELILAAVIAYFAGKAGH